MLQVLAAISIPVVVVVMASIFTASQIRSQQQAEEQRAQDAALQAYLDQMSTLLIENKLGSGEQEGSGTVRSAARARTLAVLPRLNGQRKYSVLLFLAESQLIFKDRERHIVWLVGADLSNLEVQSRSNLGWNLSKTELHGTDLSNADLQGVLLRDSSLSNTDLSGSDLSGADLTDADLTDADLSSAEGVTNEELEQMTDSLKGTTMPDGFRRSSRASYSVDHNN